MAEPRHNPPPKASGRVKPLTLGDLAKGGAERIECECDWCKHEGVVELAPLLEKAGADAAYRTVARHFRCSVCGWQGINAWPVWPGRPSQRPSRKGPPLPSIEECRAVLAATRVAPGAQLVERRAAYIRALRERFPALTASAAQFVVQTLGGRGASER
jgi:hypothetical protein